MSVYRAARVRAEEHDHFGIDQISGAPEFATHSEHFSGGARILERVTNVLHDEREVIALGI